MSDWGPLDDFDDDEPADPAAGQAQRHEPPVTREHDYVSMACLHRQHEVCRFVCKYCQSTCLCVCHRWAIAVVRE